MRALRQFVTPLEADAHEYHGSASSFRLITVDPALLMMWRVELLEYFM